MTWAVEVAWEGTRRTFSDVDVTIEEAADIFARRPSYQPRRFTFDAPWSEAASWLLGGRVPEDAAVSLTYSGRNMGTYAVEEIRAPLGGGFAEITVSDNPDRRSLTLPPVQNMTARKLDRDEIDRRKSALAKEQTRRLAEMPPKLAKLVSEDYTKIRNQYDPTVFVTVTEGMTYPIVFGSPGDNDYDFDLTSQPVRAVPLDVAANTLVVAGHPVSGSQIVVHRYTDTNGWQAGVFPLSQTTDDSGRTVTIATLDDLTKIDGVSMEPVDEALTYCTAWHDGPRGLPGDAVDVIAYLVSHTPGARVNYASLEALRHQLRGYVFAGAIDTQVSAWEVLERDILPLLPVALVPGPDGIEARHLNLMPTYKDVSRRLTAGRIIQPRTADVSISRATDSTVNTIRFRHRYLPTPNTYIGFTDLKPHHVSLGTVSALRHGVRREEVGSPWVWDRGMAGLCSHILLRKMALRRPPLEYDTVASVHGIEGSEPLEIGEVVSLTDSEAGLSGVLAIVSRITRRNNQMSFGVSLLEPGLR